MASIAKNMQNEEKIGLWVFVWREKKKMSVKEIFSFVMVIIGICAVLLAIEPHIEAFLKEWLQKLVAPLDEWPVIAAIYVVTLLGIGAYLHEHFKNIRLSAPWWGFWIIVTIIYTYYRAINQSVFEFWNIGWWVWMDILYVIDMVIVMSDISYILHAWKQERDVADSRSELLRDDAITKRSEDLLRYAGIADELKSRIDEVDLSNRAYSVGIAGEWGIGKSSLLNLFANNAEEDGQIVVRFAPRSAKNVDLIQEEFFSVFTHGLRKYSFMADRIIGKYAYALNLHTSTRWVYAILDWFENWTAESEREKINAIVRSIGKRVYVIIEDLDRLTGKEILEVLKLIDANGNFCNTVFITAYDKTYVNGVLQREIDYEGANRDFTDKYFQYEWPLFKQQPIDIYRYLYQNIYLWVIRECKDKGLTDLQGQIDQEWTHVYGKLIDHLATLRQAKRYINLFRSSYRKVIKNVDFADFVVVTLIRFLDMDAYRDIYMKKYLAFEGKIFTDRKAYRLGDKYKEYAVSKKIHNLSFLVESLFPNEGSYRQFDSQYNRINRADAFDNYFFNEIEGKLYYEDINLMMIEATLDDALARFDTYIHVDNPQQRLESIQEFMMFRDPKWVQSEERLTRYVCLVIYAVEKINNLYILSTLNGILLLRKMESYEGIMSRDEYREGVMNAFDIMLKHAPIAVNMYMSTRLRDRYAERESDELIYIDPIEFDQLMVSESQKQYDSLWGNVRWSASQSLKMAASIEREGEGQKKLRLKQLKTMVLLHPDDYAKSMMHFDTQSSNKTYMIVSLLFIELVIEAIGEKRLKKWIQSMVNEDIRYIVERLCTERVNGNRAALRIEQYVENPEQHYDIVAELMKKVN